MSLSRRRLCRRHLSVAYPHPPTTDRSSKDAYEGGTRRNSRDRARKEDFSAHSVRKEEEGSGWGVGGGGGYIGSISGRGHSVPPAPAAPAKRDDSVAAALIT